MMMIGKIINKYRIDAKLGEGGMGIIYKAWDTILERPVALKMLLPALAQDEKFLQRFRTEAKALAQLENPHIVTVFELLEVEGDWFIAMQFIEGMTLADKIKQTGPIPCTQALPIFTQLLDAMGHAHQVGIIHRDLKPGNAMITPAGVVKVMDFGLAKVQHGSILTLSTITAGTLHYMPPEQIHNLANVDQRSDIYSTGMTFYEMLAGRLPFEKHESIYTLPKIIVEGKFPPPDYYHSAVPKELAKIVMKAIAKNPAKRYQKAEEMLEALANFEAARAPAVSPPQPKPRSGTKLLYAIFSSAIVLALAVLFLLLFPDLPQRLSNFGGRPMPDTVTTKSATEADTIVSSPPETEAVTDGQTIKSAAQVGSVRIVSQP
jgi:serine/threonine protein kinase